MGERQCNGVPVARVRRAEFIASFAWSILVAYAAEAALPVQSHVVFRIALLVVATMSLTVPAHLRATYIGWRRSRSAEPALQTTLPETVGHGVLGTRS